MLVALAFSPEPQPTVSPVPDISQVSDYVSALTMIFGAVLLFIAGLAWKRAKAWFAEVIVDVKATKKQTTNSHSTNMRDDLTEALTKIDTVATSMADVKKGMETLDTRQTQMHEDLRETRKDLRFATEYVRDVDKRLIEHTSDERKKQGGNSDRT